MSLPKISLRLTLALFLVGACPLLAAQEEKTEQTSESAAIAETLLQGLNSVRRKLDNLQSLRALEFEARSVTDLIARVEIANRRHQYRTALSTLQSTIDKVPGGREQFANEQARLEALFIEDALVLKQEVDEQSQRLVGLLNRFNADELPVQLRAVARLRVEIPEEDVLLQDFLLNIELREGAGLDASIDREHLRQRLLYRGQFQAGVLRTIAMAIKFKSTQSADSANTEVAAEIKQLQGLRVVFSASTANTIRLMDKIGLDSSDLREALVVLTGAVSQEIIDADVISRIVKNWTNTAHDWLTAEGPSFFLKLIMLVVIVALAGLLAKAAQRLVHHGITRSPVKTSSLLRDFIVKSTGRVILALGILIALAQLGIQVGPLLAGLGIAGFVIGFALQDVLSNFASGIMILFYRPYDVGDYIEAGGVTGLVDNMTLVSTKVLTMDNQLLVVPNNMIWKDVIRNFTHQNKRRVDLVFGISYSDDIELVERILAEVLAEDDRILTEPEPRIRLSELGESSVNFIVRPWVRTEDYWEVKWSLTRAVKMRFDKEGVTIPFPQRDVHLHASGEKNPADS